MNRVVYPKEKELTVMAQKKKDSKMMVKIIKTAVSGVLCVALAGGIVAANVLIPPNASSVQSILGLKSGGIDNSKAKTEGINMEYSKPGFDTEEALVEDEIALNKKIAAEGIVLLKNDAGKMPYSTDTTFSFVSHSAVSYIGGNKVDMKLLLKMQALALMNRSGSFIPKATARITVWVSARSLTVMTRTSPSTSARCPSCRRSRA